MTVTARLFLGLDASTQGLKAVAVDETRRLIYAAAVSYDADLPEFHTQGGVHRSDDGRTVTAPPLLWAAALDRLLDRMRADRFPFDRIAAVSGSGQQHGSVYWKRGARERLRTRPADRSWRQQLDGFFSVNASPVWMDSSTTAECRAREAALGGPQAVADITGSRAYERFTGNQIARVARSRPDAYADTERIGLVSSFMASLLIGDYAPIDWSDGSGMNLLDIRRKRWHAESLRVTAPELAERLGDLVASHVVIGTPALALCEVYGWNRECRVVAASGDNPCSLAGLGLSRPGEIAISLGTSDTLFGVLSDPKPSGREGHLLVNPVDPDRYMAMICYKNGSLTREAVRRDVGAPDWARFGELVARTPPGNGGRIGFYIREPEITPPLPQTGTFRFGPDGAPVDAFPPEAEARAVLEGTFFSMRLHASAIGLEPVRILATGGASVDPALLRVMTDLFGVPVATGQVPDSAALGAAFRALHGWRCAEAGTFVPYAELGPAPGLSARSLAPDPDAHRVYEALLPRYAALEKRIGG